MDNARGNTRVIRVLREVLASPDALSSPALFAPVLLRRKIDNDGRERWFGLGKNIERRGVGGKDHFQGRRWRRNEWTRLRKIIDLLWFIINRGGFGDGWKIVVLFLHWRG